jgi:hypothetical protein
MSRTWRTDYVTQKPVRDGKHPINYSNSAPWWWRNLMMTRPKRRLTQSLCRNVLQGLDAEGVIWPLGNHKPHIWYY